MRYVERSRGWRANHDTGAPAELVMASLAVEETIGELGDGVADDLHVLGVEVRAIPAELDQWTNFTDREAARRMRAREAGMQPQMQGVWTHVTGTTGER